MTASVTDISSKRIKKAGETFYPIEKEFSRQVAYLMCVSEKMWHAVGRHMEVNLIEDIHLREVFRAVRSMVDDGIPLSNTNAVIQKVYGRLFSGNLTTPQFESIVETLESVEEQQATTPLHEEAAIALLAAPIRQTAQSKLVSDLVLLNSKGKDVAPLVTKLNGLDQIGKIEKATPALVLDNDLWDKFASLRSQDRLRTGIPDLDHALDGGPPPGSLMVWGADTKVGKSTAMMQQCAAAVLEGKRCLFVAMEMGSVLTMSRFMASLLGVDLKDVQAGHPRVKAKFSAFLESHTASNLVMRQLPPGSTPSDVMPLIEEATKLLGKIDCVFLDYADRMSGGGRNEKTYDAMRVVYNWMDGLAADLGGWVITGSQLQRQEGNKSPPGLGTLNDSHWKARIAHLVVNIFYPDDENKTLRSFNVAGYRHGASGDIIDSLQSDLGKMRIAPCYYLIKPDD